MTTSPLCQEIIMLVRMQVITLYYQGVPTYFPGQILIPLK